MKERERQISGYRLHKAFPGRACFDDPRSPSLVLTRPVLPQITPLACEARAKGCVRCRWRSGAEGRQRVETGIVRKSHLDVTITTKHLHIMKMQALGGVIFAHTVTAGVTFACAFPRSNTRSSRWRPSIARSAFCRRSWAAIVCRAVARVGTVCPGTYTSRRLFQECFIFLLRTLYTPGVSFQNVRHGPVYNPPCTCITCL